MPSVHFGCVVLGEGTHLSLGAPQVSHLKRLTASAVVFDLVHPVRGGPGWYQRNLTLASDIKEDQAPALLLVSCPSNADTWV